jgi:Tol biopolymer transport system component
MLSRTTAVLASTLLWVVLLVAPTQASFPGANGKIVFERDGDIWTMGPDGSNQVNITNTPTSREEEPAWSADGSQIAYARSDSTQTFGVPLSGIWVMGTNGTGQHQIVAPPTDTTVCGPGATFLGSNYGAPAWSPDGARIVFHYFRICQGVDSEFYDYDLYTVNAGGTGKALLQRNGSGPRWSPDGSKIGYTGVCGGGGCFSVRWVAADGSSSFVVYQSIFDNDRFVDWSPDGLLLAGVGERAGGFETYTIHPDGSGYTVVPNGVGTWSPDGTKFVNSGIETQNVDGSNYTQFANSGTEPDWQPIPQTGPGPAPQQSDYQNAAKFCKAERDYLGEATFRQRYGTNKNGANAHGKCVAGN